MLSLVLATLLAADAAPAPAPAPAALDTVYLANGGRARGSVVEDDPGAGVTLQLPDGTFRKYARAEIVRVEYAGEQAPPPAYPPPPMAAPPAPPSEVEPPRDPWAPAGVTFALGLSGGWLSGSVSENYEATSSYWSSFVQLNLEGGVRVTPAWTLLLQIDLGGADAGGSLRDYCAMQSLDCTGSTARIGVAARYAFTPAARNTPWVSVGLGREGTGVSIKGPSGTENVAFGGWEWLKLGAGWDLRFSRTLGLGAFTGFSLGTYGSVGANGTGYLIPSDLGGGKIHTWFQLGARLILFP